MDIAAEVAILRADNQSKNINDAEYELDQARERRRSQRFIDKKLTDSSQKDAFIPDPLLFDPVNHPIRITQRCVDVHKGVYCAAASARHTPREYSSLNPVICIHFYLLLSSDSKCIFYMLILFQRPNVRQKDFFCGKCGNRQLYWENRNSGRKQCMVCGDGKLGQYMQELLDEYNAPFQDYRTPFHRLTGANTKADEELVRHFVTRAYEYNSIFRFGSITMDLPKEGEKPKPGRFKVIMQNNALHFNISGIDPPPGRDPCFAQVFTLKYDQFIFNSPFLLYFYTQSY